MGLKGQSGVEDVKVWCQILSPKHQILNNIPALSEVEVKIQMT